MTTDPTHTQDHVRVVREALTAIAEIGRRFKSFDRAERVETTVPVWALHDAVAALPALDAIEADYDGLKASNQRLLKRVEEEHAIARDLWKGRAEAAENILRHIDDAANWTTLFNHIKLAHDELTSITDSITSKVKSVIPNE